MHIALQTISWGQVIPNIEGLLKQAQQHGFQGLEFAQHPDTLPYPPDKLRSLLEEHNLTAVGFAGGSLETRLKYAASLHPAYFYMDQWDEPSIDIALNAGYTIGLHPHYCQELDNLEIVADHLNHHPNVGLILDPAHFYLIGEDLLKALKKYWHRIVAVHLKDWKPDFGRSAYTFPRGFTYPGDGVLGETLVEMVRYLVDNSYPGWMVIEQDTAPGGDPFRYARLSLSWLSEHMRPQS